MSPTLHSLDREPAYPNITIFFTPLAMSVSISIAAAGAPTDEWYAAIPRPIRPSTEPLISGAIRLSPNSGHLIMNPYMLPIIDRIAQSTPKFVAWNVVLTNSGSDVNHAGTSRPFLAPMNKTPSAQDMNQSLK